MNERIKELLDEAQGSIDPMQQDANVFEKFAELIVKECAGIAAIYSEEGVEFNCGDAIKEHFGVEE